MPRVALVTGGTRGIGEAICKALQAAGYKVAANYGGNDEAAQKFKAATGIAAYKWDVSSFEACAAGVKQVESDLGAVDVLVNNAGALGPLGPFWENDPDAWWRAMDINLRAHLLCTHSVLPEMISRGRGRIINISSGAGVAPIANFPAYVTAKTALGRFTENLAAETKPHGISVFAIAPGTVRTALAEYSLNSPEGQKWIPWFRRIFDEGLVSPPERPAQLVLALASGIADAISGRCISVYDDLNLVIENAAEVERDALYCLRVRKLAAEKPNPVYANLLAVAGRTHS